MKKINSMREGDFLKLFFGCFSTFFLAAAFFMPDRGSMLSGLWQILSQPSKLSTNYFAVGGYSATFLNMALVGYLCLLLYIVFGGTPNNVSNLAFILTLGFGSWGINILNVWPRRSAENICPYSMWCSTNPSVIRVCVCDKQIITWGNFCVKVSSKTIYDEVCAGFMWIMTKETLNISSAAGQRIFCPQSAV